MAQPLPLWSWPHFATKEEAEAYLKQRSVQAALHTNPQFRWMQHVYPMLVNWSQVKRHLIQPRLSLLHQPTVEQPRASAVIPVSPLLLQAPLQSLALPFHAHMPSGSVHNMLRYLFFHMRCGIYVMIRDNAVKMFVPFANERYVNNWSSAPSFVSLDVRQHYRVKQADTGIREERVLTDKSRWWSNGNIVCNEPPSNVWGDHLLCQLKDMLDTTCARHVVNNVEFFINKRDFPQLRADYTEPYDFLFDVRGKPVTEERFDTLAPVFSFYTSPAFADIPLPCSEDWECATGRVFLRGCGDMFTAAKRAACAVSWEDKKEVAFFRGSATGSGVTPETNQRLHLCLLSHQWRCQGADVLDAGITSWNLRDKKRFGEPLTYIKPSTLPFGLTPFVPLYEQARFKYLIYVEGHCAANRYANLMSLGCVILKVASTCEASNMWYFPLLRPYVDHVPVHADLSNLASQIEWCKSHDEECARIAAEAQRIHREQLTIYGITSYLAAALNEVGARQHEDGSVLTSYDLYAPLDSGIPPPRFSKRT